MLENDTEKKVVKNAEFYSDSAGTGVLASIIFAIFVVVLMAVLAHFMR
jgi:hypothetical protein